jgi:hypothetical protein
MTGKTTMPDGEGPGTRATRALNKRWRVYCGIYAVVATALTAGLIMGARDPAAGPPHFTPEAAVAGAVLLPLLTLATMWFTLRLSDEVQRRLIVDAWAAGLIVTVLGSISWMFLIGGGIVPEPPGPAALATVMGGAVGTVLVAAIWLQWRRVGYFRAA